MIARAASELQVILEKYLTSSNLLEGAPVEAFGAPRRLVAIAPAVRLRQPDLAKEVTGPPKSVAYDAVGRPTRAAESFAAKQGLPLAKLYTVSTPRGDYLAAKQVVQGRPAMEVLAEVLPRAIAEIPWPRSMYWTGIDGPRFIRPIRWIVALLGGSAVQFRFAGIAPGKHSAGHRFLGASKIALRGAQDYEEKLRANFVLARPEERRKKIAREIQTLTAKRDLRPHEDPALLDLVTYLNEYPSVILGNFDRGYLDLPQEILITVMRDHQKYFAVENREGRLAPHFLAVINLERDPKGLIGAGHERVLGARFADARFFGRRIRNVGSPTICRSWRTSLTSRVSVATAIRSSACASWRACWAPSGLTAAFYRLTLPRLIAPQSSPSVTSPRRWSASSLSYRESLAGSMPKFKENLKKLLGPSTTIIGPPALRMRSHAT